MNATHLAIRSSLASMLLVAVATGIARADRVVLQDGRILEGKVTERGGELEVRLAHGVIRIPRADVVRVERAPTREEQLAARLDALDRDDPRAIAELARWCRGNGFTDQGRALEELALQVERARAEAELTRRITSAEAGGVDALLALAMELERPAPGDADDETLRRRRVGARRVLERIVRIDADHAEARRRLGQVRFRGRWEDAEKARAILAAEHAQAQRAKGLVLWKGSWMKPDERLRLQEEEKKAEHRARLRAEELAAVAADRRRREEEAALVARQAERAAAERDRARAETAALDAQRAAAEADRHRIEEERRRAAEREQVERAALVADLRGRVAALQGEIRALEAERDALRWGPTPSEDGRRRAREARIEGLGRRIDALKTALRAQQEALRRAEALRR